MEGLNLKPIDLKFDKKNHRYTTNSGDWWPGVTSILSVLPKGWLAPWAAKLASECVKEKIKPNTKYSREEIEEICYLAKTAHTRKKELAGESGSSIHDLIEQFIKTGVDPKLPDDLEIVAGYENFKKWLKENKVEWLGSEILLGSEKHKFAGTADAVARINDKLCLVDFKTGQAIYDEYAIQLAAYQLCLEELGSPAIEERWILRFPKTGSDFEVKLVESSFEEDKKIFLSALPIYRWSKKNEKVWNK